MNWYCESCKKIHTENELCPRLKKELEKHPEWVGEAADFITVAGEEALVTTQALDKIASEVNQVAGTKLTYEGTWQFTRDIQVFKRLNDEPFSRSGHFSTPDKAQSYLKNVMDVSENKPHAYTSFESKLTGYSQEVDWLRQKKGEITALYQKSELLNNNAPGVDGITVNRFTGEQINRTTIKASKNPMSSGSTGIKDVQMAVEKGTATENDIIFGPKGTEAAARDAGLNNPVIEKNSVDQIRDSNERLKQKILRGEATTSPTFQQIGRNMFQGAVVGATVGVTVSSLTTFIRYQMGEISREEAFKIISEDTVRSSLVGAAMGAVTIFLPGGLLGFIGGFAIGIYFNAACTNILDEIWGKGAFGAIMNSSGYVYGMTLNLAGYYEQICRNNKAAKRNISDAKMMQKEIERNFDMFERMKEQ